jgi:hemolysin-activating ACP:hemolysin acyltransferase|tara:strand:- start:197 stop:613 length:417 start_codon:yes stop_codon:yes gene_type:complete
MDHVLLGNVMNLVLPDPYYARTTVGDTRNSVYYAVKHGKCLVHKIGKDVVGYCTYGFFTEEELREDRWDGDEAYARDGGGILFFPKFQCRAGRREVTRFIRDVQSFTSEKYPDIQIGKGLRVYPDGSQRNEKWHRKVA